MVLLFEINFQQNFVDIIVIINHQDRMNGDLRSARDTKLTLTLPCSLVVETFSFFVESRMRIFCAEKGGVDGFLFVSALSIFLL